MDLQHSEFGWKSSDGLEIFAQLWQPASKARAVVCLVHGLGEHSGRYAHVAEALGQAGYALLGFDLRGHGRSSGQRGYTPSYKALLDDIGRLIDEAGQRFPQRPRFLYGHSMGGGQVLNYALRRWPPIAGVISASPWLRTAFKPPAWKVTLGRIMNGLWPSFSMSNGLGQQYICRDPAVLEANRGDPLLHNRISARLGVTTMDAGEWALAHADEFPLPLLLMHGSADQITSAQASQQFAQQVPSDCTFKLWEGLYHETHNDPEKEQVLAFVVAWLEGRTPTGNR
jgi:alpha-beta hydrolase superfamily lysophospholipase